MGQSFRFDQLLGVAAILVCGCGHTVGAPEVASRAAVELDCATAHTYVHTIARNHYAATACSKRAIYICTGGACRRDSELTAVESDAGIVADGRDAHERLNTVREVVLACFREDERDPLVLRAGFTVDGALESIDYDVGSGLVKHCIDDVLEQMPPPATPYEHPVPPDIGAGDPPVTSSLPEDAQADPAEEPTVARVRGIGPWSPASGRGAKCGRVTGKARRPAPGGTSRTTGEIERCRELDLVSGMLPRTRPDTSLGHRGRGPPRAASPGRCNTIPRIRSAGRNRFGTCLEIPGVRSAGRNRFGTCLEIPGVRSAGRNRFGTCLEIPRIGSVPRARTSPVPLSLDAVRVDPTERRLPRVRAARRLSRTADDAKGPTAHRRPGPSSRFVSARRYSTQ